MDDDSVVPAFAETTWEAFIRQVVEGRSAADRRDAAVGARLC